MKSTRHTLIHPRLFNAERAYRAIRRFMTLTPRPNIINSSRIVPSSVPPSAISFSLTKLKETTYTYFTCCKHSHVRLPFLNIQKIQLTLEIKLLRLKLSAQNSLLLRGCRVPQFAKHCSMSVSTFGQRSSELTCKWIGTFFTGVLMIHTLKCQQQKIISNAILQFVV
jgi:hypothetical protein